MGILKKEYKTIGDIIISDTVEIYEVLYGYKWTLKINCSIYIRFSHEKRKNVSISETGFSISLQ